jgi:hypothetical protein
MEQYISFMMLDRNDIPDARVHRSTPGALHRCKVIKDSIQAEQLTWPLLSVQDDFRNLPIQAEAFRRRVTGCHCSRFGPT